MTQKRALVTKPIAKGFVSANGHDPATSTVQAKSARVTSRAVEISGRAIDWASLDSERMARLRSAHAAELRWREASARLATVKARLGLK
jgi:hypothetical protein